MEDLLQPVRDCADPFVDDSIIGSGTEDMTDDELIEAHEKDLRRVLGVLDYGCRFAANLILIRQIHCEFVRSANLA